MRSGSPNFFVPVLALVSLCGISALAQTPDFNVGRTPSAEEIRAWDISIGPAGKELPPGSGTAQAGGKIFEQKCAVCHGPEGTGGKANALAGGQGTLTTLKPEKTVGSYWPFATSIWDYINRAMPLGTAGTLSADQVYALTAFILYRNGLVQENDVVDAKSLPKIQMPNRNGFVPPMEDILRLRCRLGTCP